MKNIFVDIDETLLHTFDRFLGETPTKDAVKVKLNEDEIYDTVLRKGAIKFLSHLRTYGEVYALTAATADYAAAMNERFNFRFEHIFSREHIQAGEVDPTLFPKGSVYLYDNLPRHENRSKIVFLRPIGNVNYIQVPGFYSNKVSPLHDELIDKLVSHVKD
jgi:hypothetical protein